MGNCIIFKPDDDDDDVDDGDDDDCVVVVSVAFVSGFGSALLQLLLVLFLIFCS